MGKRSGTQSSEWMETKRRCRLSDEDVRMAKELGFKPRSLIRNIPAKSQQWKAPVCEWILKLYEKRFGPPRMRSAPQAAAPSTPAATGASRDSGHEELLAQYDTTTGEPYFVRGSDGKAFSLEEAGRHLEERHDG